MQPAIEAQGIGKSYRERWFGPRKAVLKGVSLEVAPGEIFGILGPNGAGKTTFISILATLLRPDAGWARVLGLDVIKGAARLRERINLSASSAHFIWCMTVEENLRFYGRLYGLGGRGLKARMEELLETFELLPHRRTTFERLSTGIKQRLALAKALINAPELLFLDEPTTGLDPIMAQHLRQEILRLNREKGLTILLTTHNLREAELLCREVAFLKDGSLVGRGAIDALQQQLGLGDHVSLVFKDSPAPLDFSRLPGVISAAVRPPRVDLVVDRAEIRLAAILQAVAQTQKELPGVHLKEVDLEEIYREITH
jgi:ABC-2 type transport system ATP-binding protein